MTSEASGEAQDAALHVVRVLSDRELIVSGGEAAGLQKDDRLSVLDAPTDIKDPVTGEILGQLTATKVLVEVYEVAEKFALARTFRTRKVRVDSGGLADVFNPPKFEMKKETLSGTGEGDSADEGVTRAVNPGDAVRIWDGPVDDAPTYNASLL